MGLSRNFCLSPESNVLASVGVDQVSQIITGNISGLHLFPGIVSPINLAIALETLQARMRDLIKIRMS